MKSKTVFTIIILVILLLINVKVMATDGYSLDVQSTEIADETNELKITVRTKETKSSILGIQGSLKYDTDTLEIIDANALKDSWMLTFNKENGMFLLEINDNSFYDENEYINSNEEFLEIRFKVKDKNKKVNLEISNIKIVDKQFNTVEVENLSKTIKDNNTFKIIIILIVVLVIMFIFMMIIIKKKKKLH